MFSVNIICVGRLKDKFFEDASKEYLKRLGAYANVTVTEIKAEPLPDDPSPSQVCAALSKEAAAIKSKIPSGALVIPMCIEGKQMSSERLAAFIDGNLTNGISCFAFIIGGSCGLDESIKKLGRTRLSMSEMTFPHRLARIMLLEQIYRACKINAGEKYHK